MSGKGRKLTTITRKFLVPAFIIMMNDLMKSDSPEKEAEFSPYPRMDSYEQEEDIDEIVAEVKQSMSSQSLRKAAADILESEQSLEHAHGLSGRVHKSNGQLSAGSRATAKSGEPVQQSRKEKKDAISVTIKDIKEAIEEVKTRTVRSPYTPDEPKEPIWLMRQDISPTRDCGNQRPLDGDVSIQIYRIKLQLKEQGPCNIHYS